MTRDRIANDILANDLTLFLLGHETPATLSKVPVHDGEGDDVLETLQLAGDEGAAGLCTSAFVLH